MQLSPHFKLAELTVSETAAKLGLSNKPDADDLGRLRRLALGLEWVRTICGDRSVIVKSAYRNEQVNRAVGGVANSDHRNGDAADIVVLGLACETVAKLLSEHLPVFDQVILETDRSIVHVSFADRFRRQVLTQKTKGGKYLPGIVE